MASASALISLGVRLGGDGASSAAGSGASVRLGDAEAFDGPRCVEGPASADGSRGATEADAGEGALDEAAMKGAETATGAGGGTFAAPGDGDGGGGGEGGPASGPVAASGGGPVGAATGIGAAAAGGSEAGAAPAGTGPVTLLGDPPATLDAPADAFVPLTVAGASTGGAGCRGFLGGNDRILRPARVETDGVWAGGFDASGGPAGETRTNEPLAGVDDREYLGRRMRARARSESQCPCLEVRMAHERRGRTTAAARWTARRPGPVGRKQSGLETAGL